MRRSGVRTWVVGLVALVLGCDLQQKAPGEAEQAKKIEPVASAPPIAPTAAPFSPPPAPPVASAPTALPDQMQPVLGLSAGAALAGLFVNQLRVIPASEQATKDRFRTAGAPAPLPLRHEVTVYAVFKAPFARRLEVRALDEHSAEIGRSEREAPISQPADSSRYVTFRFDPRLPMERVRTFVVYVDPAPEVPVEDVPRPLASTKPSVKPVPRPPAPPPEPQPLDSPRPGLVPKDP